MLLQTTNLDTRWWAAVQSAWIVYMLPPSPVKPTTVVRVRQLDALPPGADAERAAPRLEEGAGVRGTT